MNAKSLVPAAMLGLGVLLISGIREQLSTSPRSKISAIPVQFDGLSGRDIIVPDEERQVAGMSDYSMRAFGPDSAPRFTIYVGYYDKQVQGKSIHSPKNCLPGAGWEIMSSERRALNTAVGVGSVNRVILSNRGIRAAVYYWYQGRGRIEASEYKVKWNLLVDAARYGRTEEALVRIVVPMPGRGPSGLAEATKDADELASRLMASLAPAVDQVLPAAPNASGL